LRRVPATSSHQTSHFDLPSLAAGGCCGIPSRKLRSAGPRLPGPGGARPGIGEIRERHHKAYDRWSPEAEAELVAAYLAGRSIEQLAADFERQPRAIMG
jgi:hypothetical protein